MKIVIIIIIINIFPICSRIHKEKRHFHSQAHQKLCQLVQIQNKGKERRLNHRERKTIMAATHWIDGFLLPDNQTIKVMHILVLQYHVCIELKLN